MIQAKSFQVYKSSAGSGKTFTLASFYLQLILKSNDPNYFSRILAITFTVKAASEMKERIISYLSAFSGLPSSRSDSAIMLQTISESIEMEIGEIETRSKQILHQILHNYADFSIFTIDKFVHRIVRSFAGDLGLNADFEIEIDQSQIASIVVSKLFDQIGEKEDLTGVIFEYAKHKISNDKSWDITNDLENLAAELNSEDFYLNARDFEHLKPNLVFEIKDWLEEAILRTENKVQQLGTYALQLIDDQGLSHSDFFQGNRGIYGYFEKASKKDLPAIVDPNSYVLKTISEDKWMSSTKNPSVAELSDELKDCFNKAVELKSEIQWTILYKNILPHIYAAGLIRELRGLYKTYKESENTILLSDFYRLLAEQFSAEQTPFVYERIGNRYKHLLIDEFQDTSTLQWQNLLPMIENSTSEANPSLIVGDAKQSIYRFRGSEPQQFVNLPKTNTAADSLFASEYEEHVLLKNYRSNRSIVEFNNRFFDQFSETFVPNGRPDSFSELEQEWVNDNNGCVTIEAVSYEEKATNKQALLNATEKRLSNILAESIFEPKDCCVLFQKNADASLFAGLLLGLGHSVISEESLLLKNNPKVQLLLASLEAAQQPNNAFSIQLWIARLEQCNTLNVNHIDVALKTRENKLNFWQVVKSVGINLSKADFTESTFQTLLCIIKAFDFGMSDPFIKKLLDFTLEIEQSADGRNQSLLNEWDKIESRISITSDGSINAVQIMTIHKAKGLEFPCVIVYLPDTQVRKTTMSYTWIENLEIPNLDKIILPFRSLASTPFEEKYTEEKSKTHSDFLNMLYVAFTRAKSNLSVLTFEKNGGFEAKGLSFLEAWDEWNATKKTLKISSE